MTQSKQIKITLLNLKEMALIQKVHIRNLKGLHSYYNISLWTQTLDQIFSKSSNYRTLFSYYI